MILSSSGAAAAATTNVRTLPAASKLLRDALPQLRAQFELHARDNANVFPLLSPKQNTRVLSRWKMPPPAVNKPAAVLVPLLMYQGQPSILFTKRASHLSRHASEISFPGGHVEEGDATLIDTALREAKEELLPTTSIHRTHHPMATLQTMTAVAHDHDNPQFHPSQQQQQRTMHLPHQPSTKQWLDPCFELEILGYATTLPSKRFMPVTPVVAVCPMDLCTPTDLQDVFPGNPDEVDRVFCVALEELLQIESNHAENKTFTSTSITRRFATPQVPVYVSEEHGTIWGLTAYILQPLLHHLFQPVLLPQWRNSNLDTAAMTPNSQTTTTLTSDKLEP